jgi:hypothetical protein
VPPALVRGLLDVGVVTQNAFGMTENHSFQYTGRWNGNQAVAGSQIRRRSCAR